MRIEFQFEGNHKGWIFWIALSQADLATTKSNSLQRKEQMLDPALSFSRRKFIAQVRALEPSMAWRSSIRLA